jgi:hypothetical protein
VCRAMLGRGRLSLEWFAGNDTNESVRVGGGVHAAERSD